ncbi:MAG TPA: ECF-type sigma factor [Thermomonas sp.]|nr:ECF-type sigma factor [Thermomonas sp.]
MAPVSPEASVTALLARARGGDDAAMDSAFVAVYEELKRAARLQLRRSRDAVDTTVLVHEAYLKLAGGTPLAAIDRNHLLALSARAMRQVLVDHARHAQAQKRGGGEDALTLTANLGEEAAAVDVLALEGLLGNLQRIDARAAQVVELRYFGGYSEPEIAGLLGISESTLGRDWRKARAFLFSELSA